MTTKMAQIWKIKGLGSEYSSFTRNHDKAIRDQFKIDREIRGTRAWALDTAMTMQNPSVVLDDETCDLILQTLA